MTTYPLILRPPGARRLALLWRGRAEDAAWVRPAFLASLLATGLLYLWNLSASGYANSFYAAAAQAGSQSWKAFFFGSLDAGNSITVDKPPAALWPMALSVRIFGLGSWQVLVPEVLMAVATAAVLYAAVRRRFSPAGGLIAVGAFALTPVAALMFRFDNPDALLALLMTVTVYCVLRAVEHGRTKWLVAAGAVVGLAFLVKTLQAFLILPPLAVLYAVCAPVRPVRRLWQLLSATAVMVVAGGWWVAIVELWPASSRPYIGGSQHNSFLELTFGYNGFGRINGDETGSVGGGGGAGGRWGDSGLGRMFNAEVGSQISWLLPAALILLVAGLLVTRRAARTDTARAAFVAWGGALLMTAGVFSFMAGIFHQYYTVALAPYLAALVGMGATVLWEERSRTWPRLVLAGTVAVTGWWSFVLLGRTPDYLPWLRWLVLAGALAGALGLAVTGRPVRPGLPGDGVEGVAAAGGPQAWAPPTGPASPGAPPVPGAAPGARGVEPAAGPAAPGAAAAVPQQVGQPGAVSQVPPQVPAMPPVPPAMPGVAVSDVAAPGVGAPAGVAPGGAGAASGAARYGRGGAGRVLAGRTARRVALGAVGVSLAASLAGPFAYTLTTLNTGHGGAIVTAGPPGAGMMGFGGGGRHGGWTGAGGTAQGAGGRAGFPGAGGQAGGGQGGAPGGGWGQGRGGGAVFPGGGFPGGAGGTQGGAGGAHGGGTAGQGGRLGGMGGDTAGGGMRGGMGGGGMGGLLDGAKVSDQAKSLLRRDAGSYTWPAAAVGSQNAASYQLATGDPVMAIGGFNGSDPSPTLAQFKKYVADGRIHYFVAGGMGPMGGAGGAGGAEGFPRWGGFQGTARGGSQGTAQGAAQGGPEGTRQGGARGGGMSGFSQGGSRISSEISSWVEATFKKVTVGDATFYDLTQKA
ncbi:glycosyltransferase family 39 protein [Streptomyces sp. TS71-3]|uniref:ArnT family glycosyltransferase n=1 Tax=Streptomyces sp. TS71-3 TaxID=2733862 RepID=UPI001B2685BD|nr:glycosyltransferase family 39 protein [Streptomyces sp. TS71-3]GHJ40140.1 hypothetical protein Sm713_57490 [Streptomyces sp. TS71-3]